MSGLSETETVIKKILPYLRRRGYDIENDIVFEEQTVKKNSYKKGYIDLLINCGKQKPLFLIEAKRSNKTLNEKDTKQALEYGSAQNVPFVVVTNGRNIRSFNVRNGQAIRWNGSLVEKIPHKSQLGQVIRLLRSTPTATDVEIKTDRSLPFRPGLHLKQLNALFARCHNAIRKIEKNEENAFDDFSKLLFLKLLEEKADINDDPLGYSYRFHELAEKSDSEADQVRDAVEKMIEYIKKQALYGEVIGDRIHLRNAKTFIYIVKELARVSFCDCRLDSKGAAFEYFVRATLKGKKLGQYFTPRPVVKLMNILVGREKIYNAIKSNDKIKVLDPACGTGGFLVYLMQECLVRAKIDLEESKLTNNSYERICNSVMKSTFFGSDANEAVACSAKMNMIIAGDGHSNIRNEDSLSRNAGNWNSGQQDCDIIITNPPFGTSETESLEKLDWGQYPIKKAKGQQLFLQKMLISVTPGGDVCTVIDEGILNTSTSKDLRRWIIQKSKLRAIIRLPQETFKPNKINVISSIMLLKKHDEDDYDFDRNYEVTFIDVSSLGYIGSGDEIRNFDLEAFLCEIEEKAFDKAKGSPREGSHWRAFDIDIKSIIEDRSFRFDLKYWEPKTIKKIEDIKNNKGIFVKDLNNIKTKRGKSPKCENYVDEKEGYALVVKAGTNITKFGYIFNRGDYIEKNLYDELESAHLKNGDVLISSTGTGTLGKACVYDLNHPAIADGHVSIIRVDPNRIDPYYLADYIRVGAGAAQIDRLSTGSTGLIELTPDDIDQVLVDPLSGTQEQAEVSRNLRASEQQYNSFVEDAEKGLEAAREAFARPVPIRVVKVA